MKQKKVPMRMCIGCHTSKPKKELLRIVLSDDGKLEIDPTGKKNGRGSYICRSQTCFEAVYKGKGFNKAYKIPIDNNTYINLLEQFNLYGENKCGGGAIE